MSLFNFTVNKASKNQIYNHLIRCNNLFQPPLSSIVDLKNYSVKIRSFATTFEIWNNKRLVSLVAIYVNDLENKIAYITNVSVEKLFQGKGYAHFLLEKAICKSLELNFKEINLEVNTTNKKAIKLYLDYNFFIKKRDAEKILLIKYLP